MTNYLIIGDETEFDDFVNGFISKEAIDNIYIKKFDEIVKINEARELKSELSYGQSAKRAFVIRNGMTIEAQNALLKLLEELNDNVYFLFYAKSVNDYLPTIHSRCRVKNIYPNSGDTELTTIFENSEVITHSEVDEISEILKKDILSLLYSLRSLLIDENVSTLKKARYYTFCKRLLEYGCLPKTNNVNEKVVLEKVFFN